ncbi:cobalt-precorrin-6A reductase [Algicella marina]|uniref:Cobalt-precorrin-6A reductase n=1 Tax=Algicella marina TaxID=2683284 RepID=A0A6P1T3R6_9RHOB|nr:cobalt-precorrin-6A reductase [Algicella marina]
MLLLAGTAEARQLAERLAEVKGVRVTASLAGATSKPAALAVPVRSGGFGGEDGLVRYVEAEDVAIIVDATHPFAARMSAHAAAAGRQTGKPVVHLRRPEWRAQDGDNWRVVPDLASAAAALPTGARAFLGTGGGSAKDFMERTDTSLTLRTIEPPSAEIAPHIRGITGRPPFDTEEEKALLLLIGATHVVAKNSGGAGGYAKLAAARALRLPVIMVARPPMPEGAETVGDVHAAVAQVRQVLAPN